MRISFITPLILILVLVSFSVPFLVSAACTEDAAGNITCDTSGGSGTGGYQTGGTGTGSSGTTLVNPLQGGASLEQFLISILDFVIRIGTIVVILMLVYVGFKFVVAQGSDSKITEAKQMLLWTLVGALILLGAEAIAIGIGATVQALSVGS